jgi:hypothetical protein
MDAERAAAALAVPSVSTGTTNNALSQPPINTALLWQPTNPEMMADSPEESETSDDDDHDKIIPQAGGSPGQHASHS